MHQETTTTVALSPEARDTSAPDRSPNFATRDTRLVTDTLAVPTRILIVDDDASIRDVLSALLQDEGYECHTASSAEAALDIAGAEAPPLVIVDLKLPGRDGIWLLEALRERYPATAVIMLAGHGDNREAVECLRRGAVDYLVKPPKLTELIRALERALAERRIEQARRRYHEKLQRKVCDRMGELRTALRTIQGTYQAGLVALVRALDAREHDPDHSQRVVKYTEAIAERLGLRGPELEEIGLGALLHDIGKLGVPDAVLLKPAKLTVDEWKEMRRHPVSGYEMIRSIEFLNTPAAIVLSHQERFDGRGYPRGLHGEEIHIGARVFAVADTLDAMTSERPYRRATSFENAVEEIQRCAGSQFDPEVVQALMDIGVKSLRRIKSEMARGSTEVDQDARDAEEALERSLEGRIDESYTTHDISLLLQVDRSTVGKWIDRGILPAYRTPAGQCKVRGSDLKRFLLAHRMHLLEELGTVSKPRASAVGDGSDDSVAAILSRRRRS